jgi:excisionase family DNA binding protein
MKAQKILEPASDAEAEMASVAHDRLVAALDHSKADHIEIVVDVPGEDGSHMVPTLKLPPNALRFFAEVLRIMARQEPLVLVPQKHELTTQEAAALLNVSRPFIVKELDACRIPHRKVNRLRRIEMKDLRAYQVAQQDASKRALDELAKLSQDAGMEF